MRTKLDKASWILVAAIAIATLWWGAEVLLAEQDGESWRRGYDLRPVALGLHLALSAAVLALMVVAAVRLRGRDPMSTRRPSWQWTTAAVWTAALVGPLWLTSRLVPMWWYVTHVWEPRLTVRRIAFVVEMSTGLTIALAAARLTVLWVSDSDRIRAWLLVTAIAASVGAVAYMVTDPICYCLHAPAAFVIDYPVLFMLAGMLSVVSGLAVLLGFSFQAWRLRRREDHLGADQLPEQGAWRWVAPWAVGSIAVAVAWTISSAMMAYDSAPNDEFGVGSAVVRFLLSPRALAAVGSAVVAGFALANRQRRPALAVRLMGVGAAVQVILVGAIMLGAFNYWGWWPLFHHLTNGGALHYLAVLGLVAWHRGRSESYAVAGSA